MEKTTVEQATEVVNETVNPLERAMQAIITTAKGGPLNCLWCGQQFAELAMRSHLLSNHPSVTKPMGNAEVALHQAAAAETALAAKTE